MINQLEFKVMVMDDNILLKTIEQHNHFAGTDFKIIQTEYDDSIFCTIQVSKYTYSDLFILGHRLSVIEHLMRYRGEIDW